MPYRTMFCGCGENIKCEGGGRSERFGCRWVVGPRVAGMQRTRRLPLHRLHENAADGFSKRGVVKSRGPWLQGGFEASEVPKIGLGRRHNYAPSIHHFE